MVASWVDAMATALEEIVVAGRPESMANGSDVVMVPDRFGNIMSVGVENMGPGEIDMNEPPQPNCDAYQTVSGN